MTSKAVFVLPSGEMIETVLMIYPDRATVCVSTQAGCAMGCVFCATGQLGLLRNLSAGQIIEQVLWAARKLRRLSAKQAALAQELPVDMTQGVDEQAGMLRSLRLGHLTNVVFMGMGCLLYTSSWAAKTPCWCWKMPTSRPRPSGASGARSTPPARPASPSLSLIHI